MLQLRGLRQTGTLVHCKDAVESARMRRANTMYMLFTAGYAGHNQASFLSKLQNHQIRVLVDVREKAFSRNRGFSKSRLSECLEANGIEYLHIRELGVPAELRAKLRAGEHDLEHYFAKFRLYLKNQQGPLRTLYELATSKTCCLMCLEAQPAECHRSVVAEALIQRNGRSIRVQHL